MLEPIDMQSTESVPSRSPLLSIVVAAAENDVIGRNGDLPWRLSSDLQRFKKLTMGHALIMGRKTYESIGRPLPGRVSVVLTRDPNYKIASDRVLAASSLAEALKLVPTTNMDASESFVVGGAEIYQLALPQAYRLYLTRVHAKPEGDAHLPEIDFGQWRLIESQPYPADDKNEFACTWQCWERKTGV